MTDVQEIDHASRQMALIEKCNPTNQPTGGDLVAMGGVDHLALICSNIDRTIKF